MHLFQVGAGSGGIVVLDLVARDPGVTRVTLVEPDIYKPHNIYRHFFPASSVGKYKAELAGDWLRAFRPDLAVDTLVADITDPDRQAEFAQIASACDLGICAADTEAAKFAFDELMRTAGKPWTMGEVLSGGIGGWIHRFLPGSACYGCVASYLQREVAEAPAAPPPDYSNPSAAQPEATIPASKASITVIAGLHAAMTLDALVAKPQAATAEFTSILFSLQVVPGVFEAAYRTHRLHIPRSPTCFNCGTPAPTLTGEALDVAVDDALSRLDTR